MTAPEVLALVLEAGGRVVRADPPRILVPRRLRPLVEEHRVELRELLRNQAAPAARNFPWPSELPLGPRSLGPFSRCARCVVGRWAAHPLSSVPLEQWGESGTWARYGSTPLCLRHALELEGVRA